ncbi:MAG: NYN domain-containing protein [Planctomycetia bacterium]|nr:NYN domain-containing protein [Planctomycetia bacterium]
MSVLIDGYNLMNVAGIVGRGIGPGALARSRLALLNFLAESLDPREIAATTVVFDAAEAPPGLPRVTHHRGLTVRFASQYPDADSLIEELIDQSTAPRRLTVVSSDHRLQRAARRRRAKPMDCDAWYAGMIARRRRRQSHENRVAAGKPPVPLLAEDVAYWLRQFGGEAALQDLLREPLPAKTPETPPGHGEDLPHEDLPDDAYNPFPPGYGEDVEE